MELRNRLVMATQMWREATADPLPRMPPGNPVEQLEAFEIKLVDMLWEQATPQTARDIADKTWDLVHDRARRRSGQAPGDRMPRGARAPVGPRWGARGLSWR